MSKLIEIKMTKATMFIPEDVLSNALPFEVMRDGIQRGKTILRQRQFEKRQKEREK